MKYRLIVNGVCFYSTTTQINKGVGDFTNVNIAVQQSLTALRNMQKGSGAADKATVGLSGTWSGFNVQINEA
jgi:hypothetical protein